MKSVGDKPAEVARRSGVPRTTLYSFLQRDNASLKGTIESKIADAYGVTVEELFGSSIATGAPTVGRPALTSGRDSFQIGDESYLPIPVYDIRASAGDGSLVDDGAPTDYQVFRDQFIARITRAPLSSLSVISVTGDSMWETLHDGDSILVDRSVARVVKDGIYVLRYDDELLVKRCQRDLESGSVLVTSDNPRYKPMTVTNPRTLDVIGRVIWIGRALG